MVYKRRIGLSDTLNALKGGFGAFIKLCYVFNAGIFQSAYAYASFVPVKLKELDYQFRVASEEEELHRQAYMKQQEEYFQKLDEMIQGSRHMKKKRASKWLKRAGDIV